jgi:hypothetical protein
MNIRVLAISIAFAFTVASGARAQEILFSVSGAGDDPDATFVLPKNPSPDFIAPGVYFGFFSIPAMIEGSSSDLFGLDFYNASDGGGLLDQTFYSLTGAQLYTGPEGSPTFLPGAYSMHNDLTGNTDIVTLTAVPELSTWAMFLAGFAGLGIAGLRGNYRRAASVVERRR